MIYFFHYPKEKHHLLPLLPWNIGIAHRQEPVSRQKGMPIYQWFYCVEGKGELVLNHQKAVIHQGQSFFLYPLEPHAYHALTPDWLLHFFGFSGPCCPEILQTLKMHQSGVYYLSDGDIFIGHIRNLDLLRRQDARNKWAECSKECYSFLIDLSFQMNRIDMAVPTQENQVVQTVVHYLEENYASCISLEDVANQVQLSKEYVCTLFKGSLQQTVIQYLTKLRIAHARILLGQYPQKKVLEIARMCGFESPSYFGKIFKKEMGITPEAYRKGMY